MKLEKLIRRTPTLAVSGRTGRDVLGVVSDSREVKPGYVFVAIPGRREDGTSHAAEAVRRGAIAVVAGEGMAPQRDVCTVHVEQPRVAVADLARAFYDNPSGRLQLLGVTGTNGKTTCTFMMFAVLAAAGRTPGMIGTVEYRIGQRVIPALRTTPEAPHLQSMLSRMEDAGCGAAVMEISSHALVQHRTRGLDFDVAVFTNLTHDHLDYHRSMDEYFEAKTMLFRGLADGGKDAVSVVNRDDPWGRRLIERTDLHRNLLTFGLDRAADITAENVVLASGGTSFTARTPWGNQAMEIRLLGRYSVSNALAAIAACGAVGVPPATMAQALAGLEHVPGRLEEVRTERGFQVFVDYAHTDDALEHVLRTLRDLARRRVIVVFGCGGERDRSKRPAMARVAAKYADLSIVTSDNPRSEKPRDIIDEIRAGFPSGTRYEIEEDRRTAIEHALRLAHNGDVVLVAGKGHENFQEFANTTIPFDDRQVVREILAGSDIAWRERHAVL